MSIATDGRQGIFGAVLVGAFALSSAAEAFSADSETKPEIPQPIKNYYVGDFAATACAFIDGKGTKSQDLKVRMQGLRGFMAQYSLGRMILKDLKKERIPLCFEDKISTAEGVGEQEAVYQPKENFIRFLKAKNATDESLAMNLAHEWDHKNDRIEFEKFTYHPRDAGILYRFSECGAFAFQVMAMYEAKEVGIAKNDFFQAGSLVDKVYRAYENGMKTAGHGQEKAWRGALDTCFEASFKYDNTDMMTSAYRLAMDYPISRKADFATQRITSNMLDEVVCPAGWDEGVLRRTGNGSVLSSPLYVDVRPDQAESLNKLEQDIGLHKGRLAEVSVPQPD